MPISRRNLITGLVSLVAAPAIVRVANIMPVKVMKPKFHIGVNLSGIEDINFSGAWDWQAGPTAFQDVWSRMAERLKDGGVITYFDEASPSNWYSWSVVAEANLQAMKAIRGA